MKKTLIFDYDGTLVDSMPLIVRGVCNVCVKAGVRPVGFEEYVLNFRFPFIEFFASIGVRFTKEKILEIYREVVKDDHVELFPDVRKLIPAVLQREYRLCIVTANGAEKVSNNLSRFGLAKHFEVYSAPEKAKKIREIIRGSSLGGLTMYVGDIVHDMREAKEAGALPVAVLRGGMMRHSHKFHKAGAVRCVPSLESLLTVL